jgi:hypothetical protein
MIKEEHISILNDWFLREREREREKYLACLVKKTPFKKYARAN